MTTLHHVRATMRYYRPPANGNPPEVDDIAIVLGSKDMDCREVLINDIRGNEDMYHLEKHDFQVVRHTSSLCDFSEENLVKSVYYPEIEELLLKRFVHLFNARKL